MLSVAALLLTTTITLSLAKGLRAYAVILGGNVCNLLPFSAYLFFGLKWRPLRGWWKWPDWRGYRAALAFGTQQNVSSLLQGSRSFAEAAILPGSLGLTTMGLINRAQALFQGTLGRFSGLVLESAYPVLPRLAANQSEYPRQAGVFLQTVSIGLVPGGVFVALEAQRLSRLLYGMKWVAADTLLLPGTLIGICAVLLSCTKNILLAAGKLRECYVLSAVTATCVTIPVLITELGGSAVAYLWLAFALQCVACATGMLLLRPLHIRGAAHGLVIPVTGTACGVIAVFLSKLLPVRTGPVGELFADALSYGFAVMVALRFLFPDALRRLLRNLPGGSKAGALLRLNMAQSVQVP
jgi:O-antigen/teichoic acid export membrane protein